MASVEERMKILKMIEEGKLSAEEGTKLLAALSERRGPPPRVPGIRARHRLHQRSSRAGRPWRARFGARGVLPTIPRVLSLLPSAQARITFAARTPRLSPAALLAPEVRVDKSSDR